MRSNIVNVVLFLTAAVGLWFLLNYAEKHWLPKPQNKFAEMKEEQEKKLEEAIRKESEAELARTQAKENQKKALSTVTGWAVAAIEPAIKPAVKPTEPSKPQSPPREPPTLIGMGDGGYNLQILLTTQGGA